jgi:predicted nucleotidyltransferase
MKLTAQMFTKSERQILNFFYTYPEKSFSAAEIARSLKLALSGVQKNLACLKEYILSKQERSIIVYELNRDSIIVKGMKRAHNLESLYTSGLVEYLLKTLQGRTISLFGSFALGEDISTSDIDIAIIGENENLSLVSFEERLSRRISIHQYTKQTDIHKHLFSSICNGIVLNGGLRV